MIYTIHLATLRHFKVFKAALVPNLSYTYRIPHYSSYFLIFGYRPLYRPLIHYGKTNEMYLQASLTGYDYYGNQ